jgi:DNA polymerase-3 subunit alpha
MTLQNFTDQFESIIFPNLGFIKIPKITISQEDKKELNIPDTSNSSDYLYALSKKGFNQKIKSGQISKEKQKEYAERLRLEFNQIDKLLFTDYILLVYKIIKYCKNHGILNSPARGSCGGSMLLYVLDVIKIDPIKHNLLFERFISAARTEIKEINGEKYLLSSSLPDVDIDSDRALKHKINEYITSLFPNRTASIMTYNTFQSKALIKEVYKCFENASEDSSKQISDYIDTQFGVVDSYKDTLIKSKEFKEWSEVHSETFKIAQNLHGLIHNKSVHASGIILCNDELSDCMPVELTSDKKIVTSYDMDYAQLIGIKVDNLGLKNLSSIKKCLEMIGKSMEDIDVNDKSIYEYLNNHNDYYYGIFQIEDGLGKKVTQLIKPKNNDDVSICIAIGRPGSMKFLDSYVKYRETGETIPIDERVADILNPTGNIIIGQEQIMALAGRMANFSPLDRDGIRKAVGKKLIDKMKSYKIQFVENSLKNNYKEEFINRIWNTFEESGNYLFNFSHSRGYSYLTCITAYLKANYPLQYFLCLLEMSKNEQDPIGEISKIHKEMIHFGIKLLPPSLSLSEMDFSIENNNIRFGLSSIKGISDKTMEKLNNFQRKHANKFQMFQCSKESGLNIGQLTSLVHAGALEEFGKNRVLLAYECQLYNTLTDKEKKLALQYSEKFEFKLPVLINAMVKELKDEKSRPLIKASRFETIKTKMSKYKQIYEQNRECQDFVNWALETKLIGYSFSNSLINIFRPFCSSLQPISEVATELDKTRCCFVGKIEESPVLGKSKKGSQYAKFIVGDETKSIKVMLFNDKLEQCKNISGKLPEEGSVVIVKGTKIGGDCVFADSVSSQQNKAYLKFSEFKEESE